MDDSGKRAVWTKLVADFEVSGQSQRAFAEARQIDLSNLRYWIYKLRNESRPFRSPRRAPRARSVAPRPAGPISLVPARGLSSCPAYALYCPDRTR
jgi:hypothetical protein